MSRALYWNKDRIRAAMQEWLEIYGKPPTANEWLRPGLPDRWKYPHTGSVKYQFGTWNNAIIDMGWEPYISNQTMRTDPEALPRTIALLHEGKTYKEIGEVLNLSPSGVEYRIRVYKEKNGR